MERMPKATKRKKAPIRKPFDVLPLSISTTSSSYSSQESPNSLDNVRVQSRDSSVASSVTRRLLRSADIPTLNVRIVLGMKESKAPKPLLPGYFIKSEHEGEPLCKFEKLSFMAFREMVEEYVSQVKQTPLTLVDYDFTSESPFFVRMSPPVSILQEKKVSIHANKLVLILVAQYYYFLLLHHRLN